MLNDELARSIAYACGESRFDRRGYDPKGNAQQNLAGRTHYADDSTLRFFHARINRAWPACEGLVFVLIESVAADPDNRARGFRFVAFDIFGTVINDRAEMENLHKTGEKARHDAESWLESFDVLAHYRGAMTERAARLARQAADMRAAIPA
jgi:hypothetical protein